MFEDRGHGFRLSLPDLLFLGCAGLSFQAARELGPARWIIPIAVGHFFLFCNVFRLNRRSEVIWAALFLVNVIAHQTWAALEIPRVLAFQLPITAAFLLLELRSEKYRGVFATVWNPQLEALLAQRRVSGENNKTRESLTPRDGPAQCARRGQRPAEEIDSSRNGM